MDASHWSEIRNKIALANYGKPALVGMAAILVAVAVVLGGILSGAATEHSLEITPTNGGGAAAVANGGGQVESTTLYVHVSGAVEEPGLYEIEAGSRVADAIRAAGGFSDDAAADSVNLARALQDGEQIVVQKAVDANAGETYDDAAVAAQARPGTGSGKVNINTATASQLEELPGIGAVTAGKIVEDRMANGPFGSVGDLTRVSGIGEKKLSAIEDLICV